MNEFAVSRRGATGLLLLLAVITPASGAAEDVSRSQATLERYWGTMIDGEEWRTPNLDYSDSRTTPAEFALRWRWGPHRQHVRGELLGIFETADGESEVIYWSLYLWHNPVTDEVTAYQVGWDGSMAIGPVSLSPDGNIVLTQVLYNADGGMKAIRHEEIMAEDGERYRSDVFERGEGGDWVLKRQWSWTRVKQDDS